MKVVVAHNRYKQRGGEDAAVQAEVQMLRGAGHFVHEIYVDNSAISSFSDKLHAFYFASHNPESGKWIGDLVDRVRADVLHVHNFFPLLSPAIHRAASEAGAAVVQTLHNYRLLCANASFLRNGLVCEKCLPGTPEWSLLHRCYQNSFLGTLAAYRMQKRFRNRGQLHSDVHRFIALTEFGKQKFVNGGFPASKIRVKPNYVRDPPNPLIPFSLRKGCLFVGRLSPEKGVHVLIKAWRSVTDMDLTIIGDGPERSRLEESAPHNVRFLGELNHRDVIAAISKSKLLVLPSICYEGLPMTILEAFSVGVPVVVSQLGAMAEIVSNNKNGLLFNVGNSAELASCVKNLEANPSVFERLGEGALRSYQEQYTPQRNIELLEIIYDEAIQAKED